MRQFLKKIAYQMLKPLGFDVPRKGMRTSMYGMLDQLIELGFQPETVIDVGVAYGTFELYEKFPTTNFLLVEPLIEYEKNLKAICQKYHAEYIMAAAGAQAGNITINVHPQLYGSSTLNESEGSLADGIPREIPLVVLDDVCRGKNLKAPYLLKIDVQGAELNVLDGCRQMLEDTEVIILEVSLFQFFVGGPQLYDVVSYMKERGFVTYDIFGGYIRPLDGALAQVDMVFVKENGLFRKSHFFATPQQRKQLV
ncbi:FkbM family methyltransferase [Microcoleus sp. CAWBG640]|uniref:FkbM family methyltransferase n=1 Tax=Microcoleus sp. CAWBG640 TaxID=2841653 RepID=UPI00312B9C47